MSGLDSSPPAQRRGRGPSRWRLPGFLARGPGVRFWAVFNGTIVAALIGTALVGPDGVRRHERLQEELEHLRASNDELRADNARLRVVDDALRHDPNYVATVIRDELGWVREDEMVFIFDGNKPAP